MKTGFMFMGMGFELVGIVLASLYFGGVIDRAFSLNGYGVAIVLLPGTAGWIAHMIFMLIKMQRQK